MKVLYERIFEFEATLSDLNSNGITDRQKNVATSLDVLYVELDTLQEKTYTLFKIPQERHQKLLDVKEEILRQYNNTALLNDVFIDHLDESVQVIIHSNDFELYKNSVLDTTESIASENFEDVAGNIDIGVKHVTLSAGASDLMCTQLEQTRFGSGYTYQCSQATIVFPATKGSDSGFVTVGHAFSGALSETTSGIATTNIQVFQPGPDPTNVNGAAKTTGASDPLSSRNWQTQLIGTLKYGVDKDGNNTLDSAFVKLASGKTVDATVKLWRDRAYPIISYESTDSQRTGSYVYQSGAATGHTSGHIISTGNERGTYASYNECRGDSGAPVGQYSSGFKLFGMHVGLADEEVPGDDDIQTASCATRGEEYSKFTTYDTIVTDLGITGITQ